MKFYAIVLQINQNFMRCCIGPDLAMQDKTLILIKVIKFKSKQSILEYEAHQTWSTFWSCSVQEIVTRVLKKLCAFWQEMHWYLNSVQDGYAKNKQAKRVKK